MSLARLLALGLVCAAHVAQAQLPLVTVHYACARGGAITATYVGEGAQAGVVLLVEGRQIALPVARAASGVRYTADEQGYVWHMKGQGALLAWIDDVGAQSILTDCTIR